MKFLDLVKPEAVKVVSTASSKKRLMQDIAALAESAYGLPSGPTVEALMEREALGPTGVGEGVALPHARLRGLDKVVGVFILLDKPVPRIEGEHLLLVEEIEEQKTEIQKRTADKA